MDRHRLWMFLPGRRRNIYRYGWPSRLPEIKVTVAKHVDHVDKEIAFQQINARMRALESDRQTRNQRNARNGTNYIPFFLQSQIDACRGMMKDLQEAEELFRVGLYISISAHSMEELEDITKVIIGACRQHLVSVKRATMRQEDGLASILPLGQDRLQLAPYFKASVNGRTVPVVSFCHPQVTTMAGLRGHQLFELLYKDMQHIRKVFLDGNNDGI